VNLPGLAAGEAAVVAPYLRRWGLMPDGAPIVTHSSRLLPVRRGDEPAMLKVACEAEERLGYLLMTW
jgi:streptomycin 6-kinase